MRWVTQKSPNRFVCRPLSAIARSRAPWWRGGLFALLACATGQSLAQPVQQGAAAISLEYAVKATYLYKLAPFVNWPPSEFATADAPFRICVAGEDPFGDYLKNAVAGRGLGRHRFQVQRLDAAASATGCQILFLGRLPAQGAGQVLDAVSGKPVLTVVDSATPHVGGIVQFVIESGRVRFEIDTAAAARNHITISSKLLNLALAVKDRP
ncbi:MAG TPA: YfiR family protein [Frateuria sp.]|uniref:YfiR family protein n=1 Tax=Frateuria sp. TaxID=2211372 RepID=UPI002DE60728|nr:YfiR family protein [Frateuria sp.]